MIAHGKDIKVFTGNSNPGLAKDICKELGIPLGNAEVGAFSDGENFRKGNFRARFPGQPFHGNDFLFLHLELSASCGDYCVHVNHSRCFSVFKMFPIFPISRSLLI